MSEQRPRTLARALLKGVYLHFYFIDDSKVSASPHSRERMGDLVAVGGVVIPSSNLKDLTERIDKICGSEEFKIPEGENIKWSPSRDSWIRSNLDGVSRQKLFGQLLDCLLQFDVNAIVASCDSTCKQANKSASNHEVDATILALERFDTWLAKKPGVVIVSKPAGGQTDSNKFVSECIRHVINGTAYVKFDAIVLNPIVMPASHSRLLQIADLIVSITNARIVGGNKYADELFPKILKLMPSSSKGVVGGIGLKLHPSFKYRNLYHWLLGDEYYVEGSTGICLPAADKPYSVNEMVWKTCLSSP